MDCIITGVSGFVGYHLANLCIAEGHKVIGVDRDPGSLANPMPAWRTERFVENGGELHVMDITDSSAISQLPTVDCLFHMAARAYPRHSVDEPHSYLRVNTEGTLNLLELARQKHIPKFILASTSTVYGAANEDGPVAEEADITRPLSPYGATKVAAEAMLHAYHHLHGMDAVITRFFTVYGPAGRQEMAIPNFVRLMLEDEPLRVLGDGSHRRDYTYVGDIVRGILYATELSGFHKINLAAANPLSVNELIRSIEGVLMKHAKVNYEAANAADQEVSWGNNEAARKLLGWWPVVDIAEGVRQVADWYLENREWLREGVSSA